MSGNNQDDLEINFGDENPIDDSQNQQNNEDWGSNDNNGKGNWSANNDNQYDSNNKNEDDLQIVYEDEKQERQNQKQDEESSNNDRHRKNSSRRRKSYSRSRSRHRSSSRSSSRGRDKQRYRKSSRDQNQDKFSGQCCDTCKQNDRFNSKTCVCVVPANQRRANIGQDGCKNCGCKGCSYEDRIKKEEQEELRNGCCKACLKAFSETGKSCMCNVPNKDRRQQLPKDGCKKCGCHGCHPYDTRLAQKGNNNSSNSNRNRKSRSNSPENLQDLNNLERSKIGTLISNQLQIFPPLLGFGIPQRTYSYLTGRPERGGRY
ncbi:hypothetical protein PPERSA_05758 [Pseudocohnilembus persalinus]|uniref:Uncharacterized protein n=1 Tax=Pseudocohnilembus persalinus TaxID=266149 RepID=A0A0V0QI39_PSEPJ|nr:hypothetical protein PPERSA_05758 [Pseudocohnilembus persalinus]|eukprot:KRX01919.1 hypothetical protein PPERSA_05758 [Pseudocohnilembus persalinus]